MKEHNLGDQVFKDTRIKGDDGKERKIIDIAENTWAAPELKLNSDNLAPESRKDVGRASDIGALAGAELLAAQSRQAKLEEASHRIKELNNYLHQPGKPLAGSELELVGFDNKGRLLLIQREVGKVVSKVLVDSDSGKIVARTKPDDLNHWEKSADYNKASRGEKSVKDILEAKVPKDWTSEEKDGGTVLKNKAGLVMAVNDRFGDSRQFKRDNAGTLTEVTINTGASSEVFRRGPSTGGVENELWYQMPYKPEEKPKGFKIEIDSEGNLSKASSPRERRIYRVDGSIIDEGPEGRKVVRKVESLVLPGNDTRLA